MDHIILNNPFLFEYFGLVILLVMLFAASFFVKPIQKIRDAVGLSLIILPVVYFFAILSGNLTDIPYTDDFNLLETIQKFRDETDFVKSMEILFEQVNQHRFAFERIVMLSMVWLTGTVNLKALILIGNLFMLGTAYLLFLALKKENISWYYFIPVPYILFNLVYFENAYWGIAAIQNTPLIFFALLSAYGIGRNDSKGWAIGLIAAIITTFVSGSGILVWIIGFIILTLQKRYRLLPIWVVLTVSIILFYFLFDYQVIHSEAEKPWKHPIFNFAYLLGFWGNALYLDIPHPSISGIYRDMFFCVVVGGFVGIVFTGWFIRTFSNVKLQWSHWLILGAFLFVMGTGCMFVISRPINQWFMHGGNLFSRRYMIFGAVTLATTYVGLIILLKNNPNIKLGSAVTLMLGFVVLHLASYFMSLPKMRKQYEELSLDGYFFKNFSTYLTTGNNFGDIPFWNHPTRMKELVASIEKGGISTLISSDHLPPQDQVILQTGIKSERYPGKVGVEVIFRRNEEALPPKSIHLIAAKTGTIEPKYFILASPKHTIVLPALPVAFSFADFIKKRTYYSQEYDYTIYRNKLPAGEFDLWIMSPNELDSDKMESRFTGKKIFLY